MTTAKILKNIKLFLKYSGKLLQKSFEELKNEFEEQSGIKVDEELFKLA